MPTLGDMKSHLADDIDDTSSTYATQIGRAITRAIEHYKKTRFAFNESRDLTFSTVVGQTIYSASDDADIPLVVKADALFHTDAYGQVTQMRRVSPQELELLDDNSAASGEPYCWSYYNKTVRIYPKPDAVYTMRFLAWFRYDAPATDAEADNPWTNEAYDLIKARALYNLAAYTLHDEALAARARLAEMEAEGALIGEANAKNGTGLIVPTCF